MADTIVMPRQGNSVESCVLVKWRVKEGDAVTPKTIVADVETDKASFEVEAGFTGTVLKLVHTEGEDVPVMQPIAYVGTPGEALPAGAASAAASAPVADAVAAPAPTSGPAQAAAVSAPVAGGSSVASPRARLLAASQGVDATALAGTGPGGRVIERDVKAVLGASAPATPAAIEEALKRGVKLPAQGTGIGGRVTAFDVANAQADVAAPVATVSTATGTGRAFPGPKTETKIKSIRKVIADRMAESLSTTAQFTLNASALAVRLQELRARFKASDASLGLTGITIGDIIVYAVSRTLKRYPYMNAHKVGDTIVEFEYVHLGIACDTPRGLMVPVIRNADTLSLKDISDETKRLAEACRAGTAKPDDLSGSTFSISNLGATGVESFTPVLNVPEVAILGVCGISPKPVQKGNDVVFLPSVGLSLTINHMVVDGAPAAKFLKGLCDAIAECDILLAK